jgi:hypothetical protein
MYFLDFRNSVEAWENLLTQFSYIPIQGKIFPGEKRMNLGFFSFCWVSRLLLGLTPGH